MNPASDIEATRLFEGENLASVDDLLEGDLPSDHETRDNIRGNWEQVFGLAH